MCDATGCAAPHLEHSYPTRLSRLDSGMQRGPPTPVRGMSAPSSGRQKPSVLKTTSTPFRLPGLHRRPPVGLPHHRLFM